MHKSEILGSEIGSIIAAVNFNKIENTPKLNNGLIIIKNSTNNTETPIVFLIKTLPATTKSKPSFKKPPTIGIELEIANFATLIEMPSKCALVIPCIDTKKPKTKIVKPKIHLIIPVKKSENFIKKLHKSCTKVAPNYLLNI